MGSAHALPVPARHSLRLPVGHILNGLGLRSAMAVSALAILAIAGAATALLLPGSSAPANTTMTPVPTAVTQSR